VGAGAALHVDDLTAPRARRAALVLPQTHNEGGASLVESHVVWPVTRSSKIRRGCRTVVRRERDLAPASGGLLSAKRVAIAEVIRQTPPATVYHTDLNLT
jgi:hypothetical protein